MVETKNELHLSQPLQENREEEHSSTITVQEYTLEDLESHPDIFNALITTYRDVFGGEPWKEWKVCTTCGMNIGKNETQERTTCPSCLGGDLEDFHPADKIRERIRYELNPSDKDPYLFLAEESTDRGREIVGFIWGYGAPVRKVTEDVVDKYFPDLEDKTAMRIRDTVSRNIGSLGMDTHVSYASEMGIVERKRGGSVFAELLQAAVEDQHKNFPTYLFWTSEESTVMPIVDLLGGQVVYHLNEDMPNDPRVFMAGKTGDMLTVLRDFPGEKIQRYFRQEMIRRRAEARLAAD